MIIQMDRFIFMKTLRPRWLSAPAWGIYICNNGQGNLTKMAAMAMN